jgi:hypothetical protein
MLTVGGNPATLLITTETGMQDDGDDLDAARGMMNAVAIGVVIWFLVAAAWLAKIIFG